MVKRIVLALLVLAGLCGRIAAAQSEARCAAQDARNGSRLCATLGFRDGRLVVDRDVSRLNTSPLFARRLTRMTVEQAKSFLFDQLDRALAQDPKPYQSALADDEKGADGAGPDDPLTAGLRTFSGSFRDYQQKFDMWAAARPGRKRFDVVFGLNALDRGGLYYPLTVVVFNTALVLSDSNPPDLTTATFFFAVADPVADWGDGDQAVIAFPDIADAT
ncbi:MAG TPA: hypothetical protein VJZ91_19095, partial [Blastocatellia bacterium]|nr:hypothetical protein [Blastocatellia bacterium]